MRRLIGAATVVAVAAETKDAAEEAARLVEIEYEELPGVYSVDQALAPDAPLVREPELRPDDDPHRESNVLTTRVFGWGDVEAEEAEAPERVGAAERAPAEGPARRARTATCTRSSFRTAIS